MSRIGYIDISAHDMKTIQHISPAPLLDVGDYGCFDERGVSYPWIVDYAGKRYMYYAGWIVGGQGGFINASGVAISADGGQTWRRATRAPILHRTDREPISTGSLCVLHTGEGWRMWYTSFDRWEKQGEKFKHFYNIKYATSEDGLVWNRDAIRCIDYANAEEHAIAKPCVRIEDGLWKMWYSYRGASYRIGYAESHDGIAWTRKDPEAGLLPSETGWDSEMVEYAHVFTCHGTKYMTYCGNAFGRAGVGLAILE